MTRFVLSILALFGTAIFLFALEGGRLLSLVVLTPILIISLMPAFAVLAVWSVRDWAGAWKDAFAKGRSPSASRSAALWAFYEKACYATGIVGLMLGTIIILSSLSDASTLGPAFAVGLVSTTYAVLFGLVARILKARVERTGV